jgi:hypothetical protein
MRTTTQFKKKKEKIKIKRKINPVIFSPSAFAFFILDVNKTHNLNKFYLERNRENPEVWPLVTTLGCGHIYGGSVFFSSSPDFPTLDVNPDNRSTGHPIPVTY